MKNYEGLSDKEIIRRLKDSNNYLKAQNDLLYQENQKLMLYQNRLYKFMSKYNFWHLFQKEDNN